MSADGPRINELRRRILEDPASTAFAQLAEECRRAGDIEEAIDICRAGLERYPAYLSARVTLGRALLELGRIDEARHEFETVLQSAPDNLAAARGLADIRLQRGAPVAIGTSQLRTPPGEEGEGEVGLGELARALGPEAAVPAPAKLFDLDRLAERLETYEPQIPQGGRCENADAPGCEGAEMRGDEDAEGPDTALSEPSPDLPSPLAFFTEGRVGTDPQPTSADDTLAALERGLREFEAGGPRRDRDLDAADRQRGDAD